MPRARGLVCISITIIALLAAMRTTAAANGTYGTYTRPARTTIMAVGDSITQGGTGFESYTAPLWSMLYGAGYAFDFIGPNSFACRTGSVANCGYGGRTAEYLDSKIDSLYARYPADVVLLLAGHNHFAEENPVDGIVTAQRSIITKILARNPEAKILVGEVIPAGKLPKYSYIPALNSALERMVRQLDNVNVKWVPAAEGFDWQRHTVADKVHPNRAGAEIIAANWMKALRTILPRPANEYHPDVECYKRLDDGTSLNLHIFRSEGNPPRGGRAAIVYFFAGGWTSGSPLQFYRECATYAAAGIVAITAEYRIGMVHGSSPAQSVEDARDAMAWVRRNADTLGIDPDRIAAAGSSAGGHLAAALATLPGMPERPDLLLLYYPVVDTSDRGDSFGDEERARALSPMQHISHPLPPTLFIVGDSDPIVPVAMAERFRDLTRQYGGCCDLHIFRGGTHPLFNYRLTPDSTYYKIELLTTYFLRRHGYLTRRAAARLRHETQLRLKALGSNHGEE